MKLKVSGKQYTTEMCFCCGRENHSGLKTEFYNLEDGKIAAMFQPGEDYQGYPERLHGGISAVVLDEALGRAIVPLEPDCWAVTAELSIRYKKPIPVNVPLIVIAEITENNRRLFRSKGELILPGGEVGATATGTYVKQSIKQIINLDEADAEAQGKALIPQENDREYIEI